MQVEIKGKPSFAYLDVMLDPGESIVAESDAMASMAAAIDLETRLNGGLLGGLLRKFLGRESLFINTLTNRADAPADLKLVQAYPGDVACVELDGGSQYLQPGAFIAAEPGVKLGLSWAGLASWLGREGLFRLEVSGTGRCWYGAYGALLERELDGEAVVDTSHLVAYEPGVALKAQLAGGLFSSFFGGEGLVTRLEGRGRYVIQTRSINSLADWLNPKF